MTNTEPPKQRELFCPEDHRFTPHTFAGWWKSYARYECDVCKRVILSSEYPPPLESPYGPRRPPLE